MGIVASWQYYLSGIVIYFVIALVIAAPVAAYLFKRDIRGIRVGYVIILTGWCMLCDMLLGIVFPHVVLEGRPMALKIAVGIVGGVLFAFGLKIIRHQVARTFTAPDGEKP